mmetsp:Transcript_15379/g.27917  ORF Transcript_15379/g.27917 Transcript_15379/m.27917 type:complete len:185 (+) Transcript_15379:255-809(+)
MVYIGVSLIVMTLGISVIIYCKWKDLNSIALINNVVEETFADKLITLSIVIDTFQYIGHGPSLKDSANILGRASDLASGGTIDTWTYKRNTFWALINSTLILIAVWMVLSLVVWLRHKGISHRILNTLAWAGDMLMPILGNIMFLPFISVLYETFYCGEGHGPMKSELEYTDSFMYRDCYEDCW